MEVKGVESSRSHMVKSMISGRLARLMRLTLVSCPWRIYVDLDLHKAWG